MGVEHLRKRFEPVEYKVYDGEEHGFFAKPNRPACQELMADILEFLAKQEDINKAEWVSVQLGVVVIPVRI